MRVLLCILSLYSMSCVGDENNLLTDWWEIRQPWLVKHQIIEANKTPENINRLIKQDSPYLLSHALQPVDWFSWGAEPLSLAITNDKLIYISVGYQTCHWCHVLAQESYENMGIANQLKRDFISIKVDRETHPELDQKYRRALENMSGNAGWPIQVILTPKGNILWIDSYTTKPELSKTLNTLAKKWRTDPKVMQSMAYMQQQQLLPALSVPKTKATKKVINAKYQQTLAQARKLLLQEQQGQGPRFLRANWLLLLLDEYLLTRDLSDLTLVITQIKQLLTSPSYDFIDGAMHRYAEDDHWQRPHYEKMLYDQALLIRVLSRLSLITQDSQYLPFALQSVSFVNQFLKIEVGYASSLSALSGKSEGDYYQFNPESVTQSPLWKTTPALIGQLLSLDKLLLPSELQLAKLGKVRRQTERPLQDEKSVLAWNALYLQSLTELYQVTADQKIKDLATELANVLIQHFYNGADLFRIVFQKKASIGATVEDYASLIVALNQAYWIFEDEQYLTFVKQISPAFIDNIKNTQWQNLLADSQLNSAAAITLKALQQLSAFTDPKQFRTALYRYKANFDVTALELNALGLLSTWNTNETDKFRSIQPFSNGKGVAQIQHKNDTSFVQIDLSPGWHINSNQPLDRSLIATLLSSPVDTSSVSPIYPKPKIKRLGFSQQPLSLYEGRIKIPFSIIASDNQPRLFNLRVQACSEKMCLLPENIHLIF